MWTDRLDRRIRLMNFSFKPSGGSHVVFMLSTHTGLEFVVDTEVEGTKRRPYLRRGRTGYSGALWCRFAALVPHFSATQVLLHSSLCRSLFRIVPTIDPGCRCASAALLFPGSWRRALGFNRHRRWRRRNEPAADEAEGGETRRKVTPRPHLRCSLRSEGGSPATWCQ